MLSPADRDICDRDPDLPGLAALLEAPALEHLAGIGPLTPVYLRYKPQTSCAAGFFTASGGALAAHAYTAARYAEVRAREEWLGDRDVIFLDDLRIVFVPARLDRGLKGLRRFFDPERRQKMLRKLAGRRAGGTDAVPYLLRYKPGRRLVARLDDDDGHPRAALKATSRESFKQALIGATGAAALGGAPVLGADASRCILVTSWIDGQLLCPATAAEIPDREVTAKAGKALAGFHGAEFLPPTRMSRGSDSAALTEIVAMLGILHPRLGEMAGEIAARLEHALDRMPQKRSLIHGDFSADQVVVRKGRAVILDWDHAAQGDPASDFGSFLARLDAQVIDDICAADTAEDIGDALMAGYADEAQALPEGIAIRHAQALLMLATEGFRERHADWPARTQALLERSAALLDTSSRRVTDPAMPALDRALSVRHAKPALARTLGLSEAEMTVDAPRLLRHKTGRRAMVGYEIGTGSAPYGHLSLLGKLRAKGLDRRTPRLHDTLHRAGLDGRNGVGVPPVFGSVTSFDMWLQARVPGRSLAALLAPDAPSDDLSRAGAALARLHATPVAPDRHWSMADEADVLDRALDRAAEARPEDSDTCKDIARTARQRLAALSPIRPCGIHRDFYFDQVMVDETCIWLLDLDLFTEGDPAIDLGNFLAHLDELGLRRHGEIDALSRHGEAFLEGYGAVHALPDSGRIALLRSVSLARHINISRHFEDRRHTTPSLIKIAHAALVRSGDLERTGP